MQTAASSRGCRVFPTASRRSGSDAQAAALAGGGLEAEFRRGVRTPGAYRPWTGLAAVCRSVGRLTQLLDEAADALERRVFFDQLSARYEELRDEPQAWSQIEAERAVETGALGDRSL